MTAGQAHEVEVFRRIAHAHEGSPQERKERYAPIAALLHPEELVVDVGCGEGLFLDMVRERGATGIGIELDPVKADLAEARGFEIFRGPAQEFDWRSTRPDFVSFIHIIEHLTPEDAIPLLMGASDALSDRGRTFLLTPNISNSVVQTNFWLDVTHVRPYPALLLGTVLGELGWPHHQTGDMTGGLETWAYAFKRPHDALPRDTWWRRNPLRVLTSS